MIRQSMAKPVSMKHRCACGGTPGLTGECEACKRKRLGLERYSANAFGPGMVPRSLDRPLDNAIRTSMGARVGHDFNQIPIDRDRKASNERSQTRNVGSFPVPDNVMTKLPPELQPAARSTRLHDDDFANKTAHALHLEAFTVNDEIYFGQNRWQPGKQNGISLLEHELGHVRRGEGRSGTVEGWSSEGHRTITLQSLNSDSRFSVAASLLLANTAPVPDFNRPQILQDMVSFWSGESLLRAPLGFVGGALIGSITPPDEGTQIGSVRLGGMLPQAILGTGVIPTVPADERIRGRDGGERGELTRTRVTQELANHGEDLPERNVARQNQYVDQGIAITNGGDLYNGLVQLGYALHIAQDRGSHGDGYTADYVQNRPHSQIDDMSANPEGLAVAINNSREAIERFYNGLNELKQKALSDPKQAGKTLSTLPPLFETAQSRASSGYGTAWLPPATPEDRERSISGTFNIFSANF